MTQKTQHPNHVAQIASLNRAIGQLGGIKQMIEERRYCVDILTQLSAARSAIRTLELNILNTHIGHCVAHAATLNDSKKADEKLVELQMLMKRYMA